MLTEQELIKRFDHHSPKDGSLNRKILKEATKVILDNIPESRESAIFVTKMEEAMFWANAAIARNQ